MASLSQMRQALADTIGTAVPSLHTYAHVPDAPQLPCLIVQPAVTDFTVAMGRGTDTYEFDLHVLVPGTEQSVAQEGLDAYVAGSGANSVRAAVHAAPQLGRTDLHAHVSAMTQYGMRYEAASLEHVGATLRAVVHTTGTS